MTVAAIIGWFDRWKVWLAMGVGILLRVVCYFSRFRFWMDELSLAENVKKLSPIEMFGPLLNQQLAPPGFLVVAWCLERLFGDNPLALRSISLLSAIAGMFLFLAVARRCLPARAVFPAVVMFASSNHLIYYASEFKQYSSDIALSLACLLIGLTVGSRPLTAARAGWLAIFGVLGVWFSHPLVFLLASVGVVGIFRAILTRDGRSVGLWLAVGTAWLASFAGVHWVAARQLNGSDQMWRFWGFGFPPWPPGSFWDATWVFRRLAYFFINPLDFDGPFDPRISMLPAIGLALVGLVRLWKLDRGRWTLLFLPVGATLAASALQLYPFHGRLLLFLTPIPLLAVAAGFDAAFQIRGRARRPIVYALIALVLGYPAIIAIDQGLAQKWSHNHHGDLHPATFEPDRFPL
jgi:hypothetical protein